MVKTISASTYQLTNNDKYINFSNESASSIAILPSVSDNKDKTITIKKIDSSINQIVVMAKRKELLNEGTLQIEKITVVGTISKAGNATAIVTSENIATSPITLSVAVLKDDTASIVADKIRKAFIANIYIGHPETGLFTITGTGTSIILTSNEYYKNDSTLNIKITNGTCEGLTEVLTSANTMVGVAITIDTQNSYKTFTSDGSKWYISEAYDSVKVVQDVNLFRDPEFRNIIPAYISSGKSAKLLDWQFVNTGTVANGGVMRPSMKANGLSKQKGVLLATGSDGAGSYMYQDIPWAYKGDITKKISFQFEYKADHVNAIKIGLVYIYYLDGYTLAESSEIYSDTSMSLSGTFRYGNITVPDNVLGIRVKIYNLLNSENVYIELPSAVNGSICKESTHNYNIPQSMPNVFQKLYYDNALTVGFVGDSITQNPSGADGFISNGNNYGFVLANHIKETNCPINQFVNHTAVHGSCTRVADATASTGYVYSGFLAYNDGMSFTVDRTYSKLKIRYQSANSVVIGILDDTVEIKQVTFRNTGAGQWSTIWVDLTSDIATSSVVKIRLNSGGYATTKIDYIMGMTGGNNLKHFRDGYSGCLDIDKCVTAENKVYSRADSVVPDVLFTACGRNDVADSRDSEMAGSNLVGEFRGSSLEAWLRIIRANLPYVDINTIAPPLPKTTNTPGVNQDQETMWFVQDQLLANRYNANVIINHDKWYNALDTGLISSSYIYTDAIHPTDVAGQWLLGHCLIDVFGDAVCNQYNMKNNYNWTFPTSNRAFSNTALFESAYRLQPSNPADAGDFTTNNFTVASAMNANMQVDGVVEFKTAENTTLNEKIAFTATFKKYLVIYYCKKASAGILSVTVDGSEVGTINQAGSGSTWDGYTKNAFVYEIGEGEFDVEIINTGSSLTNVWSIGVV